jgi:hypothetical protein
MAVEPAAEIFFVLRHLDSGWSPKEQFNAAIFPNLKLFRAERDSSVDCKHRVRFSVWVIGICLWTARPKRLRGSPSLRSNG